MHKILQNHLLCAFVADLKVDAIYALYPESFCAKNLAIRKVFAFCDSEKQDEQVQTRVACSIPLSLNVICVMFFIKFHFIIMIKFHIFLFFLCWRDATQAGAGKNHAPILTFFIHLFLSLVLNFLTKLRQIIALCYHTRMLFTFVKVITSEATAFMV